MDSEHRKCSPYKLVKHDPPREVTAEVSWKMEKLRRKTLHKMLYGAWVVNASERSEHIE